MLHFIFGRLPSARFPTTTHPHSALALFSSPAFFLREALLRSPPCARCSVVSSVRSPAAPRRSLQRFFSRLHPAVLRCVVCSVFNLPHRRRFDSPCGSSEAASVFSMPTDLTAALRLSFVLPFFRMHPRHSFCPISRASLNYVNFNCHILLDFSTRPLPSLFLLLIDFLRNRLCLPALRCGLSPVRSAQSLPVFSRHAPRLSPFSHAPRCAFSFLFIPRAVASPPPLLLCSRCCCGVKSEAEYYKIVNAYIYNLYLKFSF